MNQQQAHVASYKQQERRISELRLMTHAEFRNYELTVDAWRHQRMMKPVHPLAMADAWSWLTIGDLHGWDAARLRGMGAFAVTASDLSDVRLEHARREGIIDEYRVENAEKMSAEDGSYDVVFCKEAFHHLPRPWVGLYEMLRVARKVVLLIEPRDWAIDGGSVTVTGPKGLLGSLMAWIGRRLGRPPGVVPVRSLFRLGGTPTYEEVGNYMFSMSSREVEKVALGMDLPAVGFYALNDHFEKGLSEYTASGDDPEYLRFRKLLDMADSKSSSGIGCSSMLISALFKTMPERAMEEELLKAGWHIKKLPRNPYLKRSSDELGE
jgi:SAM-dependent methyltransferase